MCKLKSISNIFKIIIMCVLLVSCESNTHENTSIFAITNTITFDNEEIGKNNKICNKYINDSNIIQYKNENDEWIDFNCLSFGIDYDSLIVGDALLITHDNTAMTYTMLPSKTYIEGSISKVEVHYADIYEVVLHKDRDNNFSFAFLDSSIDIAIEFDTFYQKNFCITKCEDEISIQSLSEYEDGTILYYAYNSILLNPKHYTCLYDYKPR